MLRFLLLAVISWHTDLHHLLIFVTGQTIKESRRIPRAASLLTTGTRESCADAEQVVEPNEVHFPRQYHRIQRPWTQHEFAAKLHTSQNLQYNWLWIKSLPVQGLGEVTVDDVITKLESNGCLFLPWGKSVLHAVLDAKPVQLSGEVSCNIEQAREVCVNNFGLLNCFSPHGNPKNHLLVGNPNQPVRRNELVADPVKFFHSNSTHNMLPEHWEYTVDALGLFDRHQGKVYLIDMSGRGLKDACMRSIDFVANSTDREVCCGRNINKLLRYYILRLQGFRSGSEKIQHFIADHIKHEATIQELQEFFCSHVAEGKWKGRSSKHSDDSVTSNNASTCYISDDQEARESIAAVERMMQNDLGDFYHQMVKPAIESMVLGPNQSKSANNQDQESDNGNSDHPRVRGVDNVHILPTDESSGGDISNIHRNAFDKPSGEAIRNIYGTASNEPLGKRLSKIREAAPDEAPMKVISSIHETAPDEMVNTAESKHRIIASTRTTTGATSKSIRPNRKSFNQRENISFAILSNDEQHDNIVSYPSYSIDEETSQNDLQTKREFAENDVKSMVAHNSGPLAMTRNITNCSADWHLLLPLLMLFFSRENI